MPKCWTNERTEWLKLEYFDIGHGCVLITKKNVQSQFRFWIALNNFGILNEFNYFFHRMRKKFYSNTFSESIWSIIFSITAIYIYIYQTELLLCPRSMGVCVFFCCLLLFIMCLSNVHSLKNRISFSNKKCDVFRFDSSYSTVVWVHFLTVLISFILSVFSWFYLRCINSVHSHFTWIEMNVVINVEYFVMKAMAN